MGILSSKGLGPQGNVPVVCISLPSSLLYGLWPYLLASVTMTVTTTDFPLQVTNCLHIRLFLWIPGCVLLFPF